MNINPAANRGSRKGPMYCISTWSMAMPASSVMGKPTAKMLNCGETRFRMPMARFSVSRVAISGSARMSPPRKIWLPADASNNQPLAASGASAIGRV